MLQLLICRGRGHQETVAVTDTQASNNTGASNAGVDNGNNILQLGLKDTIDGKKKKKRLPGSDIVDFLSANV